MSRLNSIVGYIIEDYMMHDGCIHNICTQSSSLGVGTGHGEIYSPLLSYKKYITNTG